MKPVKILSHTIVLSLIVFICSCQNGQKQEPPKEEAKPAIVNPADTIPPFRDDISKEPVASYKVKTENPLNDWYFKVALYETEKTFHYLIKMEYEEIRGIDTLKLPNFGIHPKPVIQKGSEPYSCIIGFMDKDNQFREYKKVYVKNNVLKVTALQHYAVYRYKKEVESK